MLMPQPDVTGWDVSRVDQPVRSGSDPSIYYTAFCFCQPDVAG